MFEFCLLNSIENSTELAVAFTTGLPLIDSSSTEVEKNTTLTSTGKFSSQIRPFPDDKSLKSELSVFHTGCRIALKNSEHAQKQRLVWEG